MDSSASSFSLSMDDTVNTQSQVRMEWCGGSDRGQDVCIRLVQNSSNNDEPRGADQNDNAVLAHVLVHSNVLLNINSSFFRGMAERIAPTNIPCIVPVTHLPLVTLHVDRDDVQAYIDCFTIMHDCGTRSFDYNAPQTGVEDLSYTLRLLGAASHIDHQHLMLAITTHLTSRSIRWSSEENLLVLRKTPMRKEGLRYLIRRSLYSSEHTAAVDLIKQLLKTARVEGWRPFEQEVVALVHEDLNRLLVEAHNACDGEQALNSELRDKLMNICKILERLMEAQVASQGVKWLLQYPSIPKFLSSIPGCHENKVVVAVVGVFIGTMVSIYIKVAVCRTVILGNSDRYTLLKDWTNFLEGYEKHKIRRRGLGPQYKTSKEAIFGSLSSKQKIELVHMTAEYGYYFTFGKPEKLLKSLKNSTVVLKGE